MTRGRLVALIGVLGVAALSYWIASNTYWTEATIPLPPRGEALTNPTYAAEHYVEQLGARATRDRVLTLPPASSVIVLSAWNWNLSPPRRAALEQWVESGGRLVVDDSVTVGAEFQQWSGITTWYSFDDDDTASAERREDPCRRMSTESGGRSTGTMWLCDFFEAGALRTRRDIDWSLRDEKFGVQALRVSVGKGSVAVINADPFRFRNLFDGDHASLLITTAKLQRGDDVHFLSEGDYPTLLTLAWQRGAPVIVAAGLLLLLALWRSGFRFGPIAPTPELARRSLAEQIRGTGRYLVHHDGHQALHAAVVAGLERAAATRIPGYRVLPASLRNQELSKLTGQSTDALAEALHHAQARQPSHLPETITILETARRALTRRPRRQYGHD